MSKDFTLAEAQTAFAELEKRVGSKCQIHVGLDRISFRYGLAVRNAPLYASIFPDDIIGKTCLRVEGDTWRTLLAACEAKWAEHSDLHAANIIREIALAIIAITADQGECSDASLRARFDAADVIRHGPAAVLQANEMADRGPFSIVTLSGANDAEAA